MKLLISPTDEKEAIEAIAGGADIVDVKNPKEGALGANFPWVIKRIREITPRSVEVSCTIGDPSNLPGAASLAALGAATTGVDYIKAGLRGVKTKGDAVFLMRNITRAVKDHSPDIKVVAVGYADAEKADSVNPLLVPEIAREAEVDVAMIDTAVKDRGNLFTALTMDKLLGFVESSHAHGLLVALAGSLIKQDLPKIYALGADIVGLRSAACTGGDRINGRVKRENVRELAEIIRHIEAQAEIKV